MDARATLIDRLGRLLHGRAHRYGLDGGGIDCHDERLEGHHAPCHLIAAEIVDALPRGAEDPAAERQSGYREGELFALARMKAWAGGELEGTSQIATVRRIDAVVSRVRHGDADPYRWDRRMLPPDDKSGESGTR